MTPHMTERNRDLFDHPSVDDYCDTLECTLGWIIAKATECGLDIGLAADMLRDDTAVDATPGWARHLVAQVTHPDD